MSLEPPSPQSEIQDSSIDASEAPSEALTFGDSSPEPAADQPPHPAHRQYGRALLGLGIFAVLSSAILLITHQIKPANSMGGHEGHDITSGHSRLVPSVQVAMVDDAGEPVPMLGDSRQGTVAVAIVEPDPTKSFKPGGADLLLEIRDPDTQEPLPVEDVTVDVTMPMPNMASMTTMVQLEPAGQPGRFQVKTHFGMVGEWHIKVEVNDPDYKGQTLITVSVE
jgi:hypothetical protein